jgi:hypothetical protein
LGVVIVTAAWKSHCQSESGKGKMVGDVSGCADTNHFICGIESQTKRPASASNGRNMIGSLSLKYADTTFDLGLIAATEHGSAIRVRGTEACLSAHGSAGIKRVVSLRTFWRNRVHCSNINLRSAADMQNNATSAL